VPLGGFVLSRVLAEAVGDDPRVPELPAAVAEIDGARIQAYRSRNCSSLTPRRRVTDGSGRALTVRSPFAMPGGEFRQATAAVELVFRVPWTRLQHGCAGPKPLTRRVHRRNETVAKYQRYDDGCGWGTSPPREKAGMRG
jgi:hypothetical protein